jgi:TetR/AcrR family transcriptional regulator, tetracycline repressor protein
VARPKEPLISKRDVVAAALKLIDAEGLDALSTRRLASTLNVSGPALYHHFASKDEIVAGAVALALDEVRVPAEAGGDWREWLFRNAQVFRSALLAHPNLFPAIVGGRLPRIGVARIERALQRLGEFGVPGQAALAIIDALEAFALGSALFEASGGRVEQSVAELSAEHPALAAALGDRTLSPAEQFDVGCRAVIDALALSFWVPPAPPQRGRSRRN